MNVKNCRKCGRIFNYFIGPQICQACQEAAEAKFQEVKAYIEENKNAASINEVAEACEVEINQIRQWIREERLTFGENSVMGIDCELCGTTIRSGRFCDKCKTDMMRSLNGAASSVKKSMPEDPAPVKRSAKMRFLEN